MQYIATSIKEYDKSKNHMPNLQQQIETDVQNNNSKAPTLTRGYNHRKHNETKKNQ